MPTSHAPSHREPGMHESQVSLPVADWLDAADLNENPYGAYQRLREQYPVTWVPSINRVLISRYEDCLFGERNPDLFSADIKGALMIQALNGKPMLRKDDPEHSIERNAINPTLRPRKITEVWQEKFRDNARKFADLLEDLGGDADLNLDYAAPVASKNLIDLLGFRDVREADLNRWSLDFIAGSGNVLDLDEIWERCEKSRDEVDAVLDELIPHLQKHPDDSITSMLLTSGMPDANVRANVKLTISGGMNEPQHMVTNMVWALEGHPDQKRHVLADPSLWPGVFNETVRWLSPIGMLPRQATADINMNGTVIPKGSSVGFLVASACRDDAVYELADQFNIHRRGAPHLGFGSGIHMCAGRRVAELSIGKIAVPYLYERFPSLRLDSQRRETWAGWVFRGMTSLPVQWD